MVIKTFEDRDGLQYRHSLCRKPPEAFSDCASEALLESGCFEYVEYSEWVPRLIVFAFWHE